MLPPEERTGESGFLPPEPPGPEPDLGPRRQPPPPPPTPQPQPWAQPPRPAEPDNGPAVAGFVLSVTGAGLMVVSFLLLAFVSIVLAILGIVYSRRGKRRIASGGTRKHGGLAQAGFITGIVTLVLAVPVTALEIIFIVAYATDEEFREDFEDEFDESDSSTFALRSAVLLVKAAARLLM